MTTLSRRQAEQDVLGHAEGPHQLEVLVDHADMQASGVRRTAQPYWVVVHQELAGLRRIEAGSDVHQRRLACAILAEQRMHLAPAHQEIRLLQRLEAIEGLADAAQLQGVVSFHAGRPLSKDRLRGKRCAVFHPNQALAPVPGLERPGTQG